MIDPTIQRAQKGDHDALTAIIRELQDPWYRLCVSLLGNADAARDATQETALRFIKLLGRYRGDSHIRTWSMGIAINVVREMRRTSQPMSAERMSSLLRPNDAEAIDRAMLASESRQRVAALLDELAERQREAIILRFFEDLSVQETAIAMNCAVGTVKATVHQALGILRTKLKQLS